MSMIIFPARRGTSIKVEQLKGRQTKCHRARSISSPFYKQLLHAHIPKAQKDSQVKQLFALLGSVHVKAARKHVKEIDLRSLFHQHWGLILGLSQL